MLLRIRHGEAVRRFHRFALISVALLSVLAVLVTLSPRTAHAQVVDGGQGDLLQNVPVVNENKLNNAACGVAAATMLLDYYLSGGSAGADLDIHAVAQYVPEDQRLDPTTGRELPTGTTTDELAKGLEQASVAPDIGVGVTLSATWHTTGNSNWFAALHSELNSKHPVIVFVPDGGALGWSWHYGHYIVVSGYMANNDIIYHDPWDGKAHTVSNGTFAAAWGTSWTTNPAWWYLEVHPSSSTLSPAQLNVYVPVQGIGIYALRADSGALRWHIQVSVESSVALANGILYFEGLVEGQGYYEYAMRADTGNVLWKVPLPAAATTDATVNNGLLYIGTQDLASGTGVVYALNIRDGSVRWRFPLDNSSSVDDAIVASGQSLLVGSSDGMLYSLNLSDGTMRWQFQAAGEIGISRQAVEDGVIYFDTNTTNANNMLYAVNVSNGTLQWKVALGDANTGSPAVASGIVCLEIAPTDAEAFDAANGNLLWRDANEFITSSSAPLVASSTAYFTDGPTALTLQTGVRRWRFTGELKHQLGGGVSWSDAFSSTTPVLVDGILFLVANNFGDAYALSAQSGTLKWVHELTGDTLVGNSNVGLNLAVGP